MINPSVPHNINITYENDTLNIRVSSEQSVYTIVPNAIIETGKKRKRDFIEINNINPFVKRTRYN